MDVKLLLQIMGRQWLVEREAALRWMELYELAVAGKLDNTLRDAVRADGAGVQAFTEGGPFAHTAFAAGRVVMAPMSTWDAKTFKGFDGAQVAVIPLSGPLMKADWCGEYGTESMRKLVQQATATQSVHTVLLALDTPGGTVAGTEQMAQAVAAVAGAGKRSIAMVDELAASAGYWIASAADEVVLAGNTAMVGSIGTMVSMVDNTEAMKSRGVVLREYYATASTDKNAAYNEAIKGNGKLLIEQVLDPLNNAFMAQVRQARKVDATDSRGVLTGKVFIGQQAIDAGLADRIATMDSVIEGALMAGPKRATQSIFFSKTNIKTTEMGGNTLTLEDLKAQHPALYKAAFTEGVEAERDRVGSWMAWMGTDADAATKGIESGKPISATQQQQFIVKLNSRDMGKGLETTAPGAVVTGEEGRTPTQKEAEEAAFAKAIGL